MYPGNYPPPQGGYSPQPYGAPPQSYGQGSYSYSPYPGQAPYGAPPPGQPYGAPSPYGAPPPGQAPYGAPPPGQPYGAPPGQSPYAPGQVPYGAPLPGQSSYGAPPPGQAPYGAPYGAPTPGQAPYGAPYGAPTPGQAPYGAPTPGQAPYGAPPPGQAPYGAPPPGVPFPGSAPVVVPPPSTTTTTTVTTIPITFMPTFTYPSCDAASDATKLYKSMKGLGTDDSTLIHIMTHRSKQQLKLIQEEYLRMYHHTLEKDIKGDTSGNYQRLLCDLATPVVAYKVENLKASLKGIGTRESILIDILSQSSNAEIAEFKLHYHDLDAAIKGDTSFNFQKTLLHLLKGSRQEITVIDDHKAIEVAKEIYTAGEKYAGTDDSRFIDIFTHYSPYFLARVDYHYTKHYGHNLVHAIEKETSGSYKDLLIACTKPPDVHFADRLHAAMKGIGTEDWGLIYTFAVHDRAQLKHIAHVYQSRGYGSLSRDIEKDTSGNYRKTLLSLLE